jgi:hypothetical protein
VIKNLENDQQRQAAGRPEKLRDATKNRNPPSNKACSA